jgi:hypothetical protein
MRTTKVEMEMAAIFGARLSSKNRNDISVRFVSTIFIESWMIEAALCDHFGTERN